MNRFQMRTVFIVFWVFLVLAVNWVADVEVVAKLAVDHPFIEFVHKAIWPYIHRPYVF